MILFYLIFLLLPVQVGAGGNIPLMFAPLQPNIVTCASLKTGGDNTSGIKTINPTGFIPISVYCDMTTDGGGWMLIARSVSGGTGSFGWTTATGSASTDTSPYSMGSTLLNTVTWSSMLFGNYTSAKTWGTYIYKHASVSSTITAQTGKYFGITTQTFYTPNGVTCYGNPDTGQFPTAVAGGNSAFTIAKYIGYPETTTAYFFRDCQANDTILGLEPGKWNTLLNTADGGNINNLQGMIMVK